MEQEQDESIVMIDREQLQEMIDNEDFVSVIWFDEEIPGSKRMLRHLELIDEEASLYGIKLVKCTDKLMAKKYGFRDLPGISYFRKGEFIILYFT